MPAVELDDPPRPTPDVAAQVWLVRLAAADAVQRVARGLLADDEARRADGMLRPADRDRYVGSRAALRTVVGARVGQPPADVRFGRAPCPRCGGPHGRPIVLGAGAGLAISLSRAEGLAACALAERAVGVDVEDAARAVDPEDLAGALHPAELARIAVVPPEERRRAGLRCWVRKEAYLKGLGIGLGDDPAAVDAGAGATGPDGWALVDVPAGHDHVAALAVAATPASATVRVHEVGLGDLLA